MQAGRPKKPPARRRVIRALAGFGLGLCAVPLFVYLGQRENPGWQPPAEAVPGRAPERTGAPLDDGYSNVMPGDYVGPERCGECHRKQYTRWRSHPHSRMNRDAADDSVLGDFGGARLTYGELQAAFHRDGERFLMTLRRGNGPGAPVERYRVTRTVGSRFTQMYVGVLEGAPQAPERKLPFGYWLTRRRWLPVSYFDTDFLPDQDADGVTDEALARLFRGNHWERNCIYCHNTYPYVERLRSGLPYMPGFPREDLGLRSTDAGPGEVAPTAAERMRRRRLPAGSLVTLGISCESCHFGGREHAADEDVPPRFVPSGPALEFSRASAALVEGARDSAYVINSICAQCHAAQGVSLYPDGAATWNSREALDLLGGACQGAVKCTDCHEPHTPGAPGGGPDAPDHVAACTGCHGDYASPEARRAHTRHGDDVSCLDCHMPRVVQGLDAVIRTHRIGSPTDARMLAQASPNACNLCHLERSVRWTLEQLAAGWRRVEGSSEWGDAHGGDLDRSMLEVWRRHPVPIARLVLSDAVARHAEPAVALPVLLELLDDPNPVNRMFASFAVERVTGARLTDDRYTPTASPAVRAQQIARLRAELTPATLAR